MNIGDIAEMAGVSRAAVSRYLNNGYISTEKREKIRRVIEETGYKPSVMAQTLRTKKTKLIGVVLPRINSDSISSVVEGISAELGRSGYEILMATTDNDPEKELDYLRIFSKNRVDGVILIATVFTKDHRKVMESMSIPVVVVGQRLEGYSCVYHDDHGAGITLTDHMLQRGRRNIGYMTVLREDIAVGQERLNGYCDALARYGVEPDESRIVTAEFSMESGYEKMKDLLNADPELDGVICATDKIAVGAMKYLKEQGKRIPQDISLAGFGDNRVSKVTTPTVTTVHFHYKESGRKAASIMLERLNEKNTATVEIRMGFEYIARESL